MENFFLSMLWQHANGVEVHIHSFLTSALHGARVVNFMLRQSYSHKKKHQNSLNRTLDGPRTQYMSISMIVSSSSSCSWRIRRVSCSLILKRKLVPPSLPRSSYVSSSFDLYCNACFGILFVSILCTCCSHFSWYCFISFTIFCAPVFPPNTLIFSSGVFQYDIK